MANNSIVFVHKIVENNYNSMNNVLRNLLVGLGFNDKEAAVYLGCLALGDAPNTAIARLSKLNRVTNYEILKRLERRGAVGSYRKRRGKYFVAIDPRVVVRQAKEKVALAEESLDQFAAMSRQSAKQPRLTFLEGLAGIKSLYEDTLSAKTELLTFTSPKDLERVLGSFKDAQSFNSRHVAERTKRKIAVRALVPDDEAGQESERRGPAVLRTVKLFNHNRYPIYNEVQIYDDKVSIYSGADGQGILIENKFIAATFRSIWQMAWDKAGPDGVAGSV